MNLEQQYKSLNEKSKSNGERAVGDLFAAGSGFAATTALSVGATKISNPVVRDAVETVGNVLIKNMMASSKKGKK
jgi:hypothetical protein